MKTTVALKVINSDTIPIFKELSRAFPQSFDAERTSLNERSVINPITAMNPNSGSPGAVSIERALDEIALDETALDEIILVSLLIPPYKLIPVFIIKMSTII